VPLRNYTLTHTHLSVKWFFCFNEDFPLQTRTVPKINHNSATAMPYIAIHWVYLLRSWERVTVRIRVRGLGYGMGRVRDRSDQDLKCLKTEVHINCKNPIFTTFKSWCTIYSTPRNQGQPPLTTPFGIVCLFLVKILTLSTHTSFLQECIHAR